MAARIGRLFKLFELLKTGRANVNTLAAELKVCRRTILRDIDDLRKFGLVINYDNSLQRYTVSGNMMLPKTQFTLDEALALITLCFDSGNDIPFLGAARSAAIKLQSLFPHDVQREIHDLGNAFFLQKHPVNPLEDAQSTFEALVESTQRRQSVRIWYKNPVEEEFSTLLSPYRLFFGRHSWYAIGRSSLHREIRVFHIGRIKKTERTGKSFKIPKNFSMKNFFGNAWSMIREPGPDQKIIVRFSPLVAQNVAEVIWHPTQEISWNADRSLEYRVMVSGLNEIAWWILGYGKEAEVLQPQKLCDIIRHHAEMMLRLY